MGQPEPSGRHITQIPFHTDHASTWCCAQIVERDVTSPLTSCPAGFAYAPRREHCHDHKQTTEDVNRKRYLGNYPDIAQHFMAHGKDREISSLNVHQLEPARLVRR
jgi:hypothetical protein